MPPGTVEPSNRALFSSRVVSACSSVVPGVTGDVVTVSFNEPDVATLSKDDVFSFVVGCS